MSLTRGTSASFKNLSTVSSFLYFWREIYSKIFCSRYMCTFAFFWIAFSLSPRVHFFHSCTRLWLALIPEESSHPYDNNNTQREEYSVPFRCTTQNTMNQPSLSLMRHEWVSKWISVKKHKKQHSHRKSKRAGEIRDPFYKDLTLQLKLIPRTGINMPCCFLSLCAIEKHFS